MSRAVHAVSAKVKVDVKTATIYTVVHDARGNQTIAYNTMAPEVGRVARVRSLPI